MPSLKVALLIAYDIEKGKTTRRRTDKQILKNIKTGGAFEKWEVNSLAVELSRARKWAKSEEGQVWIEREALRMEKELAHLIHVGSDLH